MYSLVRSSFRLHGNILQFHLFLPPEATQPHSPFPFLTHGGHEHGEHRHGGHGHGGHRGQCFTGVTIFQRFMLLFTTQICPG